MTPPQELVTLVEHFSYNLDTYKSGHYNETQLRVEFIDPFFTMLGWDVHNTKGYAEAYKDVIHKGRGLYKGPRLLFPYRRCA